MRFGLMSSSFLPRASLNLLPSDADPARSFAPPSAAERQNALFRSLLVLSLRSSDVFVEGLSSRSTNLFALFTADSWISALTGLHLRLRGP